MEFFLLFFVTMGIPFPELMCKGDKKKRGGGGGSTTGKWKIRQGKKVPQRSKTYDLRAKGLCNNYLEGGRLGNG